MVFYIMRTGRVYKVIALEGNEVYVGSTFNTVRDRFKCHKQSYKKYLNGKYHNVSIFDLFDKYGVDGCKMVLIKEYEVVDDKQLKAYEQLFINKLRPINKTNPFSIKYLSNKQYREKKKEYREKNANTTEIMVNNASIVQYAIKK